MRLCHTLTAFVACFCGVGVSNSDAFVVVGVNAGANENMADNLHRNKARRVVHPMGHHVAAAVGPMAAGSLSRLGGGIPERCADRLLVPFRIQGGSVSTTNRNSRTILYNIFGDVKVSLKHCRQQLDFATKVVDRDISQGFSTAHHRCVQQIGGIRCSW